MKKKIIIITIVILIILALGAGIIGKSKENIQEGNNNFKIVTSFYPVYIMTLNITQGAENIELVNMTDTNVGCLHDYTLSTSDMKKIEKANVLIENGLGLESFNDKIYSAYQNLKVVNSSENIQSENPHIWTSIENCINQVEKISAELTNINSENAEIYKSNSQKYIQKLQTLKTQYETELKNLNGKKVVCLNEAFECFANEINLDTILVETDHEESTLSAEKLKSIIQEMKENNIKAIIVDENDNLRNAQTLALETGAEIYKLNSCLTGNLQTNAYINAMTKNLEELKKIK